MHHLEKQLAHLSKINGHLFLGSEDALTSKGFKREGITHVVSIIQSKIIVADSIKHLHIQLADSSKENIRCHFEQVLAFIDDAIAQGGKVLVHCEKGMSRSASFVIAWLMHDRHRQGLTVDYADILQELIKLRSVVSPNKGFVGQLMDYARELNTNFMSLGHDSLSLIISDLSPESWSSLGRTCRFFRHFVTEKMDKLWIAHLTETFKLSQDEIDFWQEHKLSFPVLFNLYKRLNAIPFPKKSMAFAVGFFGNKTTCTHFIKNAKDNSVLVNMLTGAIFGFKADLIKSYLGSLDQKSRQELLSYAVMADNVNVLKHLDNDSLNWHVVNLQGSNLLFIAAFYGSYNAFLYLHLTKGVDPAQKNQAGASLLEALCYSTRSELIAYVKELKLLDPNAPNHSGLTPWVLARTRKNTILLSAFEEWPALKTPQMLGATGV